MDLPTPQSVRHAQADSGGGYPPTSGVRRS